MERRKDSKAHDLATLRVASVTHRTDGAGGFFLISIRCSFWRSPFVKKPYRSCQLKGVQGIVAG
jgi:hypothetical protein